MSDSERKAKDLLFVGLNGRVLALDRYDGSVVWEWKVPKAASFVSVLVDGDRLIAGANRRWLLPSRQRTSM